jgi:hypothetical protein
MNSQLGFLVKIALASTIISIVIKYGGSLLPVIPTRTLSLILVCSPSLILALLLGLRLKQN